MENCILSEGRAGGNSRGGWGRGLGGNIYMTGGRLLRSLVTGGCGAGFRSGSLDAGGGMKGFRPRGMLRENPLVDGGCSFEEYSALGENVSGRDISGDERMSNRAVDIGCFEARWRGSVLKLR